MKKKNIFKTLPMEDYKYETDNVKDGRNRTTQKEMFKIEQEPLR